ncbi:MAG: class IV adenylate cyclase, partial [Patescibacteria group bacterium]
MQIEFEAKFTKIDKEKLRGKLKAIGAKLVRPEFLMKRVVFDPPVKIKGGWLRVRDDGQKVYLSLKVVDGSGIKDQKEIEVEIGDFSMGCKILESIGARRKAYQETKREMWKLSEVEFDIDTWPGLNPFLEIEGENEKQVKDVANKLG